MILSNSIYIIFKFIIYNNMSVKLEGQDYLVNKGLSSKQIKDVWNSYAFKFNFISEEFEKYRKDNKLKENPLKVDNHPIIVELNDENKIDEQSNILLDFINTEFSIEGCVKFASKYGLLGVENNFNLKNNEEKLIKAELLYSWLWELANIKNIINLIIAKQELNKDKIKILHHEDLFNLTYKEVYEESFTREEKKKFNAPERIIVRYDNKFKGKDTWAEIRHWSYEQRKYKLLGKNNFKFEINIEPQKNLESNFKQNLADIKYSLTDKQFVMLIDDILLITFNNFYKKRIKVEVNNSDGNFTYENQTTNLIGKIWDNLFQVIKNNNIIKHCYFCKDIFITGLNNFRSDREYCSNSCAVNGSRVKNIFNKNKKDFEKKGYILKLSEGNLPNEFRYWLLDSNNKLIAGLDISQNEISETSQKFNSKKNQISNKIDLHNSNNDQKIFYAFLINKNDEKFMYKKSSDEFKKVAFIVQTTDLKDAYEEDKIINLNETTLEMLRIKDEVIELPRFYRKDIA